MGNYVLHVKTVLLGALKYAIKCTCKCGLKNSRTINNKITVGRQIGIMQFNENIKVRTLNVSPYEHIQNANALLQR